MKKSKALQTIISKLVENSFQDGKIMEVQVIRAIKVLKLQSTVDAIYALSEYLKQLKRKQRVHTMYIETVIPLSQYQINQIKKIIEKKIQITKVSININPLILGGFKLRVGDEIWDESILGKINQVKEVISGRFN